MMSSTLDADRRPRARQQEVVGIIRMADRHVAERIDHVVMGENPVGGDEIFFQLV